MSEWQPIETAPRDGAEVVLFRHGWDFCPVAVWMEYPGNPVEGEEGGDVWMEGWGFELDVNLGHEEGWLGWNDDKMPTHWMPLPAPPKGDSDE